MEIDIIVGDELGNLSPQNLALVEIGKDFMLSHGYIKHDFDVRKWAAPEFLGQAAKELINERWQKVTEDNSVRAQEVIEFVANKLNYNLFSRVRSG